MIPVLPQAAGFLDHPGQFLDKQGHPIGPGDNVLHHLRGQRLASCHVPDEHFDLWAVQTVEGERHDMRARRPWGDKVRAESEHV